MVCVDWKILFLDHHEPVNVISPSFYLLSFCRPKYNVYLYLVWCGVAHNTYVLSQAMTEVAAAIMIWVCV